jgi:hypothetical protein
MSTVHADLFLELLRLAQQVEEQGGTEKISSAEFAADMPREIGNYRIERMLGAGASSIVYLGRRNGESSDERLSDAFACGRSGNFGKLKSPL